MEGEADLAIAGLLDRSLPFIIRDDANAGGIVHRIFVSRSDLATIIEMRHDLPPQVEIERADRWISGDALECLNGNRSAGELLSGIDHIGSERRRLLPVDQVLARAAAGVTTFDLTRRSGIGTSRVAARLKKNHVEQLAPGLWERTRAEELTLRPDSW